MPEEQPAPPPIEAGQDEKKKKKKDKVRSAWISFIGRIVAQVVGAVATIVLGLVVAQRLQDKPDAPEGRGTRPAASAERRAPGAQTAGRRDASLAVLPLQNLSGDPQQEYFADGMTEALIANLAKIRALRVISRTSAMHYKGTKKPLLEIARELGVDSVVEGSVARQGNRVRVTAQLIDARSDEHLWAQSYERPLSDVLALQADLAGAIAREVNVVLSAGELGRLAPSGSVDPEAYAFYLRGRHAWNQRTIESLESAIRYFTQAIGEDPGYAAAFSGLADSYSLLGGFLLGAMPPREAMTRAKAAAEKALALAPHGAEAQTSVAWVRFRYDWDWAGAERGFRRALELNPGYATAHQWYAVYLGEMGRHEDALPVARRAVDIDPLSPLMRRTLARIHMLAGRLDEAETEAREAIELDPGAVASHLLLVQVLIARGDHRGAIEVCEGISSSQRTGELLVLLGYALARSGQRGRAQEALEKLQASSRERPASPHHLALLYVGLGDHDAAFRALEKAVAERSDYVVGLKAHTLLEPLRRDRRYQALLQRVGLPG
jgi:TolB-like protein/Tfp pilus assembly protein PilF